MKTYMQQSLEGSRDRVDFVPRTRPRNDAVSRVAASMSEAMTLSKLRNLRDLSNDHEA